MQSDYIALLVLWAVVVGVGSSAPSLSSNYNISAINDFALVSPPLQVPLSLPRNSDPLPHTPIHQKYSLQYHRNTTPNLNIEGLKPRMLHIDYQLILQEEPPLSIFESKYNEDYHLLQNREFIIMLSNPSQIFTICLQQVFSDCQSIKKTIKKPLPFCINPFTKYPLHFNLYVTAAKNRQLIKSAIFFNATIKYQHHSLINKIWMKQVRFNLLPNHLKLYSFQLRNCRQQHSVVSIKNPQKNDLALMIVYKHKKLFMNNQPFDQKVTIAAGKIFRFMIEGRDATMTIYTHNPQNNNKVYPILYIPLYCLDQLTIEHVPIGIISAKNLALTYPLLVTSHSSSLIHIQEIELLSSSQAIELVKSPTHKIVVHPNEKFIQIGAFIVRSTKNPAFKNTISLRIIFKYTNHQNSSETGQINRNLSYTEMYNPIEVGSNRYYDVSKMKTGQYNDTEKITHFNYSIINNMQIPIKLQRIFFNSQRFRMHWFRYSGTYIFPKRVKQQILIQYTGPRNLPLSPVKYAAAFQLNGGMLIPFELLVYDNTLTCIYQGKQQKCSKLKLISFGYQKTDLKIQTQTITFKNHNPTNISLQMKPYILPHKSINFSINISKPFPYYQRSVIILKNKTIITLLSGHTINFTIQVQVSKTIVGDMHLSLSTPFQNITPRIRFHFETGKLLFSNQTIQIPQFDLIHHGLLNLSSTYQDSYSIKQVISTTSKLQFNFNETQQFQQLETAIISYTYNPNKDSNVTEQCCAEDFIKNYYLNAIMNGQDTLTTTSYEVAVITSSEIEQKATINVKPIRSSLLNTKNTTLNIKVIKANMGAYFCLNIINPYEKPMKYSISFLSHSVINKPKDFFTYLKHAKRERVDTYFCIKGHGKNQNQITPTSLKSLFRLQDKPTELSLGKGGSYTDPNPAERTNLSNNDYLNSFTQTGKQICYKFTSILYMKLLIQSQVINELLDRYSFNFTEKLIQRQHQNIQDTAFIRFYDQFYTQIPLNLQRYCHSAVYPIFRFCQHIPLKNISPSINSDPTRKNKRINKQYNPSRVIASKKQEETCYMLHGHHQINKLSFQLLISNNYSKFDDYNINMNLIQPKIIVGDIAFEQNHKINLTTFLKHYFSTLYKSLKSEEDQHIIKQNGIKHKSNIIPVYFTNQDYDDNFGIFKGERFFQLANLSPIDIDFTHYGFQNKQNIRFFSGFSIEQIGVPQNSLILAANSKSTFRISFNIDRNFYLNISNPIMHHHINLYLYKSNHYHIHLHLVFKVADNIIAKIKAHSEENQYQSSNSFGYIIINLVSLSFICAVISQLKKQEEEKQIKLKIAKQKLNKIENINSTTNKKDQNVDFGKDLASQKIKKRTIILPSTSIGTKIHVEPEKRNKPYYIISQQQLSFFKTLKVKEDKSIISQSSQSQPLFQLSQTESEKPKTDEQSKSENEQIKVQRSELQSLKADKFQEQQEESEQEQSSSMNGSEHSLTQSILPDGISVCNEQMDIDQNMDFQFGFQKEKTKPKMDKKNSEEEYVYYNVFSSHHPLKQKKQEELFPWMIQNEKKKSQRTTKRKIE